MRFSIKGALPPADPGLGPGWSLTVAQSPPRRRPGGSRSQGLIDQNEALGTVAGQTPRARAGLALVPTGSGQDSSGAPSAFSKRRDPRDAPSLAPSTSRMPCT